MLHSGDPCLVLAGAGSGKTRVITHRIAYLIGASGVPPQQICALTFTNKAAAEMRARVEALLGNAAQGLWLLTFHALGLRFLREASGQPGCLPRGFAVYDRNDALAIWRSCQRAENIDLREYPPSQLYERCSRAINRLENPAGWDHSGESWDRRLAARIYSAYRLEMSASGAADFDDLLVGPVRALATGHGLSGRLAARFRHVLVDEYQDTNRLQYRFIKELLGAGETHHASLMVVGDEDQAIYRWRGADLSNVLDFQRDFPGAKIIRLEQNYRSSQSILSAAGSLVAHNQERLGKSLWSAGTEGHGLLPEYRECVREQEEAAWVASEIVTAARSGVPLDSLAVLYRTNAQSRAFEQELTALQVPHRVLGAPSFLSRVEVRDLVAYLRLLCGPDDVAFRRAVSTPARGIGPATIRALDKTALDRGPARALDLLIASENPREQLTAAGCRAAGAGQLIAFGKLIRDLRSAADRLKLPELLRAVAERSGYMAFIDGGARATERRAVLEEMFASAEQFFAGAKTNSGPEALETYLDRTALVAGADSSLGSNGVSLLTLHAAKGLEFDTVFLAGLEEGLLPHASATADGQLEEERRLCYVGMTRARRRLCMTGCRLRRIHGSERLQDRSRFVAEIDPSTLVVHEVLALGTRKGSHQASGQTFSSRWKPKVSCRVRSAAGSGPTAESSLVAHDDLQCGAEVVHPTFGRGKITAREGTGERLKLTIRFRSRGTKQVLARYAKLRVAE